MTAHLIQILLPVKDNEGKAFERSAFERVSAELSERFGGATAFVRSPARGLWETREGRQRDDVIIIETMAEELDEDWWRAYRGELEKRFCQDSIVIRSQAVLIL